MATGYQSGTGDKILRWRLGESLTSTGIAAPSAATDGVSLREIAQTRQFGYEDVGAIVIGRTDTSKAVSIAAGAAVLGYSADLWGPLGSGATGSRGQLNQGLVIAGYSVGGVAQGLLLVEQISGLRLIERLAVYLPTVTLDSGAGLFVDLVLAKRRS